MYNWRQMTQAQRDEVLQVRRQCGQPWHGPPHGLERELHHISAACYMHNPVLGATPQRLSLFERDLLCALGPVSEGVLAWCVLPNHYHVLLLAINLPAVRRALGQLHGRMSREWNVEDQTPGRTCWHRCLTKPVTSDSHRWATLNYIHHNPVHHGYVKQWTEWSFSSARQYLDAVGREFAEQAWKAHPLLGFGKGWDEPEM